MVLSQRIALSYFVDGGVLNFLFGCICLDFSQVKITLANYLAFIYTLIKIFKLCFLFL